MAHQLSKDEQQCIEMMGNGVKPAGEGMLASFTSSKQEIALRDLQNRLRTEHSPLMEPGEDGKTPRLNQIVADIKPSTRQENMALTSATQGDRGPLQAIDHQNRAEGKPPFNTMINGAGQTMQRRDELADQFLDIKREEANYAQMNNNFNRARSNETPEQAAARRENINETLGIPAHPTNSGMTKVDPTTMADFRREQMRDAISNSGFEKKGNFAVAQAGANGCPDSPPAATPQGKSSQTEAACHR